MPLEMGKQWLVMLTDFPSYFSMKFCLAISDASSQNCLSAKSVGATEKVQVAMLGPMHKSTTPKNIRKLS